MSCSVVLCCVVLRFVFFCCVVLGCAVCVCGAVLCCVVFCGVVSEVFFDSVSRLYQRITDIISQLHLVINAS